MSEIVGACLSQFHDDADTFEVLLIFADGREIGHSVSRKLGEEIAAVFSSEFEAAKDAEIERLREALKFYADAWRFTTNPKRPGLEWKPKEDLLDDCGNIARDALSKQEGTDA